MIKLYQERIAISGIGNGSISTVLYKELQGVGAKPFYVGRNFECAPDTLYAICLSGKIYVGKSEEITDKQLAEMWQANYLYPRQFIDRYAKVNGCSIIVVGSNAARYGGMYVEDYAAMKAALLKYTELKGRTIRENNVKLALLNFGGIDSLFWNGVNSDCYKGIVPDGEIALSITDVVRTIIAVMTLPDNVVIKDATIVSKGYQ